jgi:hypothetical protein
LYLGWVDPTMTTLLSFFLCFSLVVNTVAALAYCYFGHAHRVKQRVKRVTARDVCTRKSDETYMYNFFLFPRKLSHRRGRQHWNTVIIRPNGFRPERTNSRAAKTPLAYDNYFIIISVYFRIRHLLVCCVVKVQTYREGSHHTREFIQR